MGALRSTGTSLCGGKIHLPYLEFSSFWSQLQKEDETDPECRWPEVDLCRPATMPGYGMN